MSQTSGQTGSEPILSLRNVSKKFGAVSALTDIELDVHAGEVVALVGGGGQGKTALAEEAARWLLAMRRVERVAFVSVEQISEARAVLDVIGRQLVPGYLVGVAEGTGSDEEKLRRALLPVEGVLQQRRVLIVVVGFPRFR